MAKGPGKAKGSASSPAPDPAPEPTPDGFSLGKLWASIGTIPKILGGIVATLAALGTLYGYIRSWGPADVSMSATCRNDQIRVDLVNTGGRAARVGLPRFTIVSTERHDDLDHLEPYLKERPVGDRFELASGPAHPLEYDNPLDFFGKNESARSCHFEISVPIEGRPEPLLGTCTCTYVDR